MHVARPVAIGLRITALSLVSSTVFADDTNVQKPQTQTHVSSEVRQIDVTAHAATGSANRVTITCDAPA